MKILFLCLSTLKFNVTTPFNEPLGGTESAISYLTPELAKRGHQVTLMANCTEGEREGVKHVPVSENIGVINPDVIVVTSAPQAAPGIKRVAPAAKLVLWNHMQPDQPSMLPLFHDDYVKAIDNIVYVSENQRKEFTREKGERPLPIDGPTTHIINNAIAPCFENMFTSAEEIQRVKKCRGVYTSTPYRGLSVLTQINELPIEIYSSMKVYQGDDQVFFTMYENLRKNKNLTLKGSVSQKDLMKAMRELAFLVYPSIFAECHSIAVIEAMAAGLKVITTDMASPQTEFIDSMSSTGGTVFDYSQMLRNNINYFRSQPEKWAEQRWKQVQYVNSEFTWKKKAQEWEEYLNNICKA